MKKFFNLECFTNGFIHAVIAFAAIVTVGKVLGLSLSGVFLFAGLGTIIFHLVTQNKLPSVLGISGSYIAVLFSISNTYGSQYIGGAVVVSGLVYLLFGILAYFFQEKMLKAFPDWLLSMSILLIALSLLPIGQSLAATGITTAIMTIALIIFFQLQSNLKLQRFSMMAAILCCTVVNIFISGVPDAASISALDLAFNLHFNFAACLSMALISIVTINEMLADIRNTGDIIGVNVFEEVGIARISIGNGLATILAGAFGFTPYTTYSENAGVLISLKYYNPWAQVWTGLLFIGISFFSPLFTLINYIPMSVFGGVLLFLYGLVGVNSIKQLQKIDLEVNAKVLIILSVMLGTSFLPIALGGIPISGAALALITGMVLNKIIK